MRTGFTASASAHVVLIAVGLMSLGAAEQLKPETVESISVDLVAISDFTNIRAGSLDSQIVEIETPAIVQSEAPAVLAQPTGNTEKDQVKPTEAPTPSPMPALNTAPEPEPEPVVEPEPTPTPAPAPAPRPPAPTPEPVPEPVAPAPELAVAPTPEPAAEVAPKPVVRTASLEQKRAAFKTEQEKAAKDAAAAEKKKKDDEAKAKEAAKRKQQEAAKQADQVANIINNETSRGAVTGAGGTPTLGKPTGQSATLSRSEIDALVGQIKTCWNVPPGAAEAGFTVRLKFSLNRDGSVSGQPQVVQAPATSLENTTAQAAVRAVLRCGPYQLAAEKYEAWQQVDATFDPRDVF